MLSRGIISPTISFEELTRRAALLALTRIRYFQPRIRIPKAGNLHLAFQYASIPSEQHHFIQMLCVTPAAFHHILSLIQNHSVFLSRSPKPQAPVELQLVVTLYRAGRYRNGAGVDDVARIAGLSEGSVLKFSDRVCTAILSLESVAMRKITEEEKEREKDWVKAQVRCQGFHQGWCTGDGTLIRLHQKPGLNGNAYFSRKMQYDLNVQARLFICSQISVNSLPTSFNLKIVNTFTNLRIVDYVTGFTGSAHDSGWK